MFSWSRTSTPAARDRFETGRPSTTTVRHSGKNEEQFVKIDHARVLQTATVDVRHARAVHVTTKCVHGVSGGMCGATHCGLGAVLPISSDYSSLESFSVNNSFPTTVSDSIQYPRLSTTPESTQELHYFGRAEAVFDGLSSFDSLPSVSRCLTVDVSALDDILADVDVTMENKTTNQWKSTFQNVREKFRDGTPPRELQLAVDTSQTLPKFYRPSTLMADSMVSPDSPRAFAPLLKSQSDMSVPTTTNQQSLNSNRVKPAKRSYKEVRQELLKAEYLKTPVSAADYKQRQQQDQLQQHRDLVMTEEHKKPAVSDFWLKSVNNQELTDISDTPPKFLEQNQSNYFSDYSQFGKNGPQEQQKLLSTHENGINFSELNSLIGEQAPSSPKMAPVSQRVFFNVPEHVKTEEPKISLKSSSKKQQPVKPLSNGSPKFPVNSEHDSLNFSALDSAVQAVNDLSITNETTSGDQTDSHGFKPSQAGAVQLMTNMSNYLQKSVAILNQDKLKQNPDTTFDLSKVVNIPVLDQKNHEQPSTITTTVSVSHSPSPDTSSNASDTPAGLPHPKPKHHLREQLQTLGLEPRSPTNFNRSSVGWSFSNLGAVAERVQQFEKFPTKQLRAAEAALNTDALKNFFGKGAESIYKTKPVIQVNLWNNNTKKADRQSLEQNELRNTGAKHEELKVENLIAQMPNRLSAVQSPESKIAPIANLSQKFGAENEKRAAARTTAQKVTQRRSTEQNIPRFYFPKGKPKQSTDSDLVINRAKAVFAQSPSGQLIEEQIDGLMKACDLPLYWKKPVFLACGGGKKGFLIAQDFALWWKQMSSVCHDEASKFVYTLVGPKKHCLTKEDLEPMIQDIVDTFPGLYFLRDAPEFHSRYIQTVIARIFFGVNRSWSGKITLVELRNSNFLEVVKSLDTVEDINLVTEFFSYEHFYVIYCKFWELDRDHDLFIDRHDLARHDNGAISQRIIDRIFSGAVNRGARGESKERLSYADFVSFLIAEEDKRHPTSIEYWFRCLDTDGDGVLSMFELQYFYEEQERKMMAMSIEPMAFSDVLCQMLDIVRPKEEGKIRLRDLKGCRMTGHFLNAFINVHKYYDQESSETERASVRGESGEEISDWDRFCAEEYEALMQEEQIGQETEINCDDSDTELDQYLSMSAPEATRSPMSILDTL